LLTRGAVCQITLSLLTLPTHLKIDWITSGKGKMLRKAQIHGTGSCILIL